MKLKLLSLLALLGCCEVLASEFDSNEEEKDDVFVVLPKIDTWEYVPDDKSGLIEEPMVETDASLSNWSIMSFLGNFFPSSASPAVKKSESFPAFSDADLNIEALASSLNCEPDQLAEMNPDNLKRLATLTSLPHAAILARLADIGDLALFELFFRENAGSIMSEVTNSRDFHAVVFDCIKMKSMNSFFNVMFNPKYPLNGPQAVVFASMYGSAEILKFVLEQRNSVDYDWSWKNIDGSDGYMLAFGTDPYTAALFLAAIKAINLEQIDCLHVLIQANVDLESKAYLLLKETVKQPNRELFVLIHDSIPRIPDEIMSEVLALAIQVNDEAMVHYLLTLKYKYNVRIKDHLMSAISTKNPVLFNIILRLAQARNIDGNVLNHAAASGNEEIFLALIKVSSPDAVLTALCSCILNEQYRHYVPLICENVTLSAEMISQGLMHSIRIGSGDFVNIFLKGAVASKLSVKSGFMAATESNNMEVVQAFLVKFKNADLLTITERSLTALVNKLFELKAWESLHALVIRFFEVREFPRHLFLAMIMETDQVEIARTASSFGVSFPQFTAADIKDTKMREFLLSRSTASNSKAQSKNRK